MFRIKLFRGFLGGNREQMIFARNPYLLDFGEEALLIDPKLARLGSNRKSSLTDFLK